MTRWYKNIEAKGGNAREEMLEELLNMFRTDKITIPLYEETKWGQEESEEEALKKVNEVLKKGARMNLKQIFRMV